MRIKTMNNKLIIVIKTAICWGMGVLAFFYLNRLTLFFDSKGWLGIFLSMLLILSYCGVITLVSWIDKKLGFKGGSKILGCICGAAGVPTVIRCAMEISNRTYYSGMTWGAALIYGHIAFAAVLFAIGYAKND